MNIERVVRILQQMRPRFEGQTVLVFGPDRSLPDLWRGRSSPLSKIAVGDAWRIVPDADILYHTDERWWEYHRGVPAFQGLKVSYGSSKLADVVTLRGSGPEGYDLRLGYIRHGKNSGTAAIHLAAQLGAAQIILIGITMSGGTHFFGDHPREIKRGWCQTSLPRAYILIAELKKRGVEVLNATPNSMLKLPWVDLDDALMREAA